MRFLHWFDTLQETKTGNTGRPSGAKSKKNWEREREIRGNVILVYSKTLVHKHTLLHSVHINYTVEKKKRSPRTAWADFLSSFGSLTKSHLTRLTSTHAETLSIRAATDDYFHYRLICLLLSIILVFKMFPRSRGDVPEMSRFVHNPKILSSLS